jgi:hypothetical protein
LLSFDNIKNGAGVGLMLKLQTGINKTTLGTGGNVGTTREGVKQPAFDTTEYRDSGVFLGDSLPMFIEIPDNEPARENKGEQRGSKKFRCEIERRHGGRRALIGEGGSTNSLP